MTRRKKELTTRELWEQGGVEVSDPTAGTEVVHDPTGFRGHHLCAHCGSSFKDTSDLHKHLESSACADFIKRHEVKYALFGEPLDEPVADQKQGAARSSAATVKDKDGRLALMVGQSDNGDVRYIEVTPNDFVRLHQTPLADFDMRYKYFKGYPTGRSARLFAGVARMVGATAEAMTVLASLVTLPNGSEKFAVTRMEERSK